MRSQRVAQDEPEHHPAAEVERRARRVVVDVDEVPRDVRAVSRLTPTQLYACQKICTGALALAELRAQVDRACADGECSVEVQRDLEDVVIGVEDTLQRTVELVLEQLDVNGDKVIDFEEFVNWVAAKEEL